MSCHANKCIACSVAQCAIQVGTHEADPTMDQCTDCKSFRMK